MSQTRAYTCFVDSMRPVTPAEKEGWACFLALHREHWRDARIMFRQVFRGVGPDKALATFVAGVGFDDEPMCQRLRTALRELAREAGR